ncbi:MAG: FAD-binding oxidoreductase [Burkholderiaceae bacterium]|nr:FAD-binding oxidoreductase [Burkholderiaceae bacterium]
MSNPSAGRRAFLSGNLQSANARSQLAARLGREMQGDVLMDHASRGRYATDASIYQVMPIGVAIPKTDLDARVALDIARDLGLPVLPRGAGTSQCGQTVGEALVIDNSKYLNRLLSLDLDAMTVTVQPGMVLDQLNAQLKPHGVWFPVDVSTAAQCTIGGMAGNNSCGSRSLYYGNMVHNVAGLDAVLADGTRAYFGSFGDGGDMRLSNARLNTLIPRLFQIAESVREDIAELWPKVMRRVGGYNLDVFYPQSERPYCAEAERHRVNFAQLLVGSEGTLGYFESLKLKLSPLPKNKRLGVVNFPSFHQAMTMTRHIVDLKPIAVELVDRTMIELSRANPVFAPVIEAALTQTLGRPTDALLLVEFAHEDSAVADRGLHDLERLMADLGLPGSVVPLADARAQTALWEVRKAGLNIMMSLKGDGKPVSFIEDCAVPLEHLADYTAQLTEVFARHGTQGTWYAHASVGTLHVRPILDMRRDGAQKMRAIAEEAAALVRRYKGAFSGEHGDGLVRSEWVRWQFGDRITHAFEQVKAAFDPDNRMNPGKIVHCSKMDDASLFRFSPRYQVESMPTGLDWSAWNVDNDPSRTGEPGSFGIAVSAAGAGNDPALGFSKAVEMCNNNGHCRKFDAGTMCPSYRITRDEQHSVRGRANTLRLALSGQLGASAWQSSAVRDALELCVGCKGCKRECPTGVDMARMKIEAAYQVGRRAGFSRKDRMIAALPFLAQRVANIPLLAGLLNLRNRSALMRALGEKWLGIAAERPLPVWRRDTFARSAFKSSLAQPASSGDLSVGLASAPDVDKPVGIDDCDVILWADTFNNAYEPEHLHAAFSVMRRLGFKVFLSGAAAGKPLCCGRTHLSVGMIEAARVMANETLQALAPAIDRGVPVVGLEPSCLLSMRDEWKVMRLGPRADRLAQQAMLFEEWWMAAGRARAEGIRRRPLPMIRVHGHCHQKALGAISPTLEALTSVGATPDLIESSCCGMAGSFGYEAQHLVSSLAMAEASLLPAVRTTPEDAWIVADGFSCRHQIRDAARRESRHVAQVIAYALDVTPEDECASADRD